MLVQGPSRIRNPTQDIDSPLAVAPPQWTPIGERLQIAPEFLQLLYRGRKSDPVLAGYFIDRKLGGSDVDRFKGGGCCWIEMQRPRETVSLQ
jgi:hypothetical protein